MKRKILSLILVFAMTVSLLTVGTGAVEPTYGDTAGHWAESSIERWSAYGIIQGSNGQFDPNGQLTCAQLATILAKLLKLPAAKDAGFTDNTADAWYYDAINRCAAAGILNGNGDGTVTPEAPITRERAMVMLARALGIEPIRKPDLTKYTDAAQVSAYAQGYVAALIEAGIVGGVTADELAPQDNINRASTVTILDRAISVYADKDGMTVNAKDGELVLVVAKNVKVINAPEGTKIVVADGATGLTVNGKSVSDDQTYIVPKTTTSSGSSSSGGGHSHSYTSTVTKEPTCTEKGEKTFTCTRDGSTYTEEIPALGHALSGWVKDNNHLSHTRTCTRFNCSYSETENCKYTVTTANDRDTYTCPVCGDTYEVKKDSAVRIGETGYTTLDAALDKAKEGNNTIVLLKNLDVTTQINVTKSVTIEGAGYTITAKNTGGWAADNSNKHLLNITASNVTIKNLTLDSSNQACGNQAWADPSSSKITNVKFTDVTMKGSLNAGLIVKHAEVTAENLTTSGNAGGGVNVDGGTPHFDLTGNSTLNELNKIWAEKVNGPAVVTATGYYCHLIKDEKNREFYAWSTSVSDTAVAKVKVGEVDVYYTSLSNAITNAKKDESTTISLTANAEVTLDNGVANEGDKSRNVTFVGDGTQKVDVITKATDAEGGMLSYQRGSTFTFENVTIQAGEGNFDGIVCDELVYNNCIIKGKLTLYGKATFINCTFENTMADQYSIWTWGGTDVKFEKCTFNTNGKAILLYGQATAKKPTNLTVSNCTFNDRNNGSAGKAAIEIGNDYNATYSLTVTNATVNGFADGKNTGSKIWANKNSMDAKHLTVIIDNKYVLGTETPKQTVTVATAEELKEKLTTLTSAGSGNNVINIDGDFQLANGETWTPVTVDGYNGAGVITINGNGHTIKGLNAPLIAGGFAGKSGVVIKDLTLENVTINDSANDQGIGAFIGCVDSMPQIELNNCHLKSSTIASTGGARVGGLIGWTSGYDKQDDGPVATHISITNCSVEDCTITAKGSVGAIIGHAGANPATYHTITGCTVKDCTLTSTDDGGWRVGVVVGTANVGEVTIKNITTDNNTVTQTGKTAPEGQSDLYGRFVPVETGKLTIDNIEIK